MLTSRRAACWPHAAPRPAAWPTCRRPPARRRGPAAGRRGAERRPVADDDHHRGRGAGGGGAGAGAGHSRVRALAARRRGLGARRQRRAAVRRVAEQQGAARRSARGTGERAGAGARPRCVADRLTLSGKGSVALRASRARQAAPAVLGGAALRSGSFAGSVGAGQRYSSRARAGRSLIAGQGLLCMTCSPSASSTADACTPRASARRSWPTARALTAAPALMKVCAARAVLVALAAVGPRRLRLHAQRQRLPRAEGARRRQLADRAVTCRPCIP